MTMPRARLGRAQRLGVALLTLDEDASAPLLGTFVLGGFAVTVAGCYVFEVLLTPDLLLSGATARTVLAVGVMLALALALFSVAQRRARVVPRLAESAAVPQAVCVLTALAPLNAAVDNQMPLRALLAHHSPRLTTVGLVCVLRAGADGKPIAPPATDADAQGVLRAYNTLAEYAATLPHPPKLRLLTIADAQRSDAAFDTASAWLSDDATPALADTLIDITAGTKPLSVGLALAALTSGVSVSYFATRRDRHGDPTLNAAPPAFVLVRAGHDAS